MLGSCITVHNLFPSKQGDSEIINVLRLMGAEVQWDAQQGVVTVEGKQLKGINFDAGFTPDLVPTVAVLAAVADGVTVIGNAKHVRYKETDRLHAMAVELSKMGIMIKEEPDSLTITGGKLTGADLHGWHDHRIVMALTLAAMVAGKTTIDTADSVSISYPKFFEEISSIGAKIEMLDE
jgi:3-phosphoshikimate 1-carboxyvinyltransferase